MHRLTNSVRTWNRMENHRQFFFEFCPLFSTKKSMAFTLPCKRNFFWIKVPRKVNIWFCCGEKTHFVYISCVSRKKNFLMCLSYDGTARNRAQLAFPRNFSTSSKCIMWVDRLNDFWKCMLFGRRIHREVEVSSKAKTPQTYKHRPQSSVVRVYHDAENVWNQITYIAWKTNRHWMYRMEKFDKVSFISK